MNGITVLSFLPFLIQWLSVNATSYNTFAAYKFPSSPARPDNQRFNRFEEVYRWKQMSFTPLDNGKNILHVKLENLSKEKKLSTPSCID